VAGDLRIRLAVHKNAGSPGAEAFEITGTGDVISILAGAEYAWEPGNRRQLIHGLYQLYYHTRAFLLGGSRA
jgi:hypothetical protein